MGDANTGTEEKPSSNKKEEVRFVVTGFGPFQSVTSNPTSIMSEQLMEHLHTHPDPAVQSLEPRTTTTVLEVSADAVKAYLDKLQKEQSTDTTTVLLHMGVNYLGKGFQLEQCAYNDATFRIPDEKGYQPQKECVVQGLEWDKTLSTTLNVQEICKKLHEKYPGSDAPVMEKKESDTDVQLAKRRKLDPEAPKEPTDTSTTEEATPGAGPIRIFPSTDPGRYVCNYTYCYSLDKFGCHTDDHETEPKDEKSAKSYHSLFLHVPPFQVIPQEEQLKFVVELMKLIEEQVQCKNRQGRIDP